MWLRWIALRRGMKTAYESCAWRISCWRMSGNASAFPGTAICLPADKSAAPAVNSQGAIPGSLRRQPDPAGQQKSKTSGTGLRGLSLANQRSDTLPVCRIASPSGTPRAAFTAHSPSSFFHCSVPAFMIAFPSYIDKQGISE